MSRKLVGTEERLFVVGLLLTVTLLIASIVFLFTSNGSGMLSNITLPLSIVFCELW